MAGFFGYYREDLYAYQRISILSSPDNLEQRKNIISRYFDDIFGESRHSSDHLTLNHLPYLLRLHHVDVFRHVLLRAYSLHLHRFSNSAPVNHRLTFA